MLSQEYKSKGLILFLFTLYMPSFLCLFAVSIIGRHSNIPYYRFFRDPSMIAGISPFNGVVSNIGVLLWCATSSVCLLGWALLRQQKDTIQYSRFLFYFGGVTAALLFDDLFLFHDWLFPFKLHWSEHILFYLYGGLVLAGLLIFRRCILKTEYPLLILAFFFFALSLSVDEFQGIIQRSFGNWRIFFEDGFKLLGIVGWFGYFFRCCYRKIGQIHLLPHNRPLDLPE